MSFIYGTIMILSQLHTPYNLKALPTTGTYTFHLKATTDKDPFQNSAYAPLSGTV